MTACGAIGALMVGGKVVGQLRCELDERHLTRATIFEFHERMLDGVPLDPTPHRVVLEWQPEDEVDLDLFDPDERFDVDVPA